MAWLADDYDFPGIAPLKPVVNILLHLKVAWLHPGDEAVNEASDVITFDAVIVILQVVDDVMTNGDLLLGVCCRQLRVELIQWRHVDVGRNLLPFTTHFPSYGSLWLNIMWLMWGVEWLNSEHTGFTCWTWDGIVMFFLTSLRCVNWTVLQDLGGIYFWLPCLYILSVIRINNEFEQQNLYENPQISFSRALRSCWAANQ